MSFHGVVSDVDIYVTSKPLSQQGLDSGKDVAYIKKICLIKHGDNDGLVQDCSNSSVLPN